MLTFSWRPGWLDDLAHLVIDGQTQRPWVWAVCARTADPRGEPTGERCPDCRAWLRREVPPASP